MVGHQRDSIMRFAIYLLLFSSLCAYLLAEDQKIDYQNSATEDTIYNFIFEAPGNKYNGSNGTITFARKPKDEIVCDIKVRLPSEKEQGAINQALRFSYTRVGIMLKCDILSVMKGKSIDGHFFAILSQTIPIAIPLGLYRAESVPTAGLPSARFF